MILVCVQNLVKGAVGCHYYSSKSVEGRRGFSVQESQIRSENAPVGPRALGQKGFRRGGLVLVEACNLSFESVMNGGHLLLFVDSDTI